jgi:hypothetical protein
LADSILVALTKAVATALSAATFDIGTVDVGWDFDGRDNNARIEEGALKVTAVVPKRFIEANRESRTELGYVAAVDIDITKGMAQADEATDQTIHKDELTALTRLTEQVHQFFQKTLSEARLTLADQGLIAEWIDERDGNKSEILLGYSEKYLQEAHQYYGVCREVFELTNGTA